jgi:hypothetical protein
LKVILCSQTNMGKQLICYWCMHVLFKNELTLFSIWEIKYTFTPRQYTFEKYSFKYLSFLLILLFEGMPHYVDQWALDLLTNLFTRHHTNITDDRMSRGRCAFVMRINANIHITWDGIGKNKTATNMHILLDFLRGLASCSFPFVAKKPSMRSILPGPSRRYKGRH